MKSFFHLHAEVKLQIFKNYYMLLNDCFFFILVEIYVDRWIHDIDLHAVFIIYILPMKLLKK